MLLYWHDILSALNSLGCYTNTFVFVLGLTVYLRICVCLEETSSASKSFVSTSLSAVSCFSAKLYMISWFNPMYVWHVGCGTYILEQRRAF